VNGLMGNKQVVRSSRPLRLRETMRWTCLRLRFWGVVVCLGSSRVVEERC
jgi:hypothetical protein